MNVKFVALIFLSFLIEIFCMVFNQSILSQEMSNEKLAVRQSHLSYCRSFKSCHDCKKTTFQCEWCNDIGCTSFPRLHCPRKVFLDDVWKKNRDERFCTEIVSKQPIFVPANVRRFIKLDLRVDDLTLYERNVICELQIEQQIIQVPATFDDKTAYCDTAILKSNRNIVLGYLRLNWGGLEPYSNTILVIVYSCQNLAQTCKDCLRLDKEYSCGWCKESASCTLLEKCARQYEPWLNKSSTCGYVNFHGYRTALKKYFD